MFLFTTQTTVKFSFLPHSPEVGPFSFSPTRVKGLERDGGREGAIVSRGMRGSFIRTRRLGVVLQCSLLQEKIFLLSAMSYNGLKA